MPALASGCGLPAGCTSNVTDSQNRRNPRQTTQRAEIARQYQTSYL